MSYVKCKYITINEKFKSHFWLEMLAILSKLLHLFEPRCEKTHLQGFRPGSDTNRPVQSHKEDINLKFFIKIEEELYYPSSESKGADQLCSYCTADLHLCIRICKNLVFSSLSSFNIDTRHTLT